MKVGIYFLIYFFILNILNGQQLLVEGDAMIEGRIDLANQMDSTEIIIGREAGHQGMVQGTSSSANTFVGVKAGRQNTGKFNTFFGFATAFAGNAGDKNSFFGMEAGASNGEGINNTFLGVQSGGANDQGSHNTFVGEGAGIDNTTGSYNTFIGTHANFNNPQQVKNSIAIGYNAKVNCDHCAVIGGTGIDSVRVGIGTNSPSQILDVKGNARFQNISTGSALMNLYVTTDGTLALLSSDRQLKTNFKKLDPVLNRLANLSAYEYQYKFDAGTSPEIGFIAQEVEQEFPLLVFSIPGTEYKSVHYEKFTPVLVEAINELQEKIQSLEEQIKALTENSSDTTSN